MTTKPFPTIYVPHGGGPWPFVDIPTMPASATQGLRDYLTRLPASLPAVPRAVLVVSAHWEEALPTVQLHANPPLLYDYSGFPPASYEITWPAPGSPEIAKKVRDLLEGAQIPSAEDSHRGFDHGTFVVTKLMYPEALIPTLQLSLTADLDPRRLWEVGRALAPLRDEGVLLLGSGFSYHNMRGFMQLMRGDPQPAEHAHAFDEWLHETLLLAPSERHTRLIEWERAPSSRACHPREEHLLPLMVCAGAAGEDPATAPFRQPVLGLQSLAAHFG